MQRFGCLCGAMNAPTVSRGKGARCGPARCSWTASSVFPLVFTCAPDQLERPDVWNQLHVNDKVRRHCRHLPRPASPQSPPRDLKKRAGVQHAPCLCESLGGSQVRLPVLAPSREGARVRASSYEGLLSWYVFHISHALCYFGLQF